MIRLTASVLLTFLLCIGTSPLPTITHVQVWRIGASEDGGGAERFCALVRYQGSFSTLAGPSPQGTDNSIAANIDGSFEGGYRLVFNADEIASPTYRDRGHSGTFTGPIGLTDWQSYYFANVGANDMQWWGWIYHGGNNGARATSTLGEQGDITERRLRRRHPLFGGRHRKGAEPPFRVC